MRRFAFWFLVLPLSIVPARAQEPSDPWLVLTNARAALVSASPLEASFVQTFTPNGFTTGDSEGGRLNLALPDCLRWDYREPFPRSYLLCGDTVHIWNPDEAEGRRIHVDRSQEPGLDLLLLSVETLRSRYSAEARFLGETRIEVSLSPLEPMSTFKKASLEVDRESSRPVAISYQDQDGNVTRFDLSEYQPSDDPERFIAPSISWEDG